MNKINFKNLEETGIDSISIHFYTERRIEYISESFEEWQEITEFEEKYTRNVIGKILGSKDFGEEIVIGQIAGTFFEAEAQINDTNFWEVCDSINGDLEHMASIVVDNEMRIKEEICTMNNSIFYLDEIFIDEKYRGHGIGRFILKQIDKMMQYTSNLDIGTVITYPFAMEGTVKDGYKAIEDEEKEEETLYRLRKFYRSCGFKNLGSNGHMYKKYSDTFDYYK